MKNSELQKILGIAIHNKLIFGSHVKNLCKKVWRAVAANITNFPFYKTHFPFY